MEDRTPEEILCLYNSLNNKYIKLQEEHNNLKNENKKLNERVNYNTEETIEKHKKHIEKLEEEICGYKLLNNKGNVYALEKNAGLMTFKTLFHYALKDKYNNQKIQYYSSFEPEEQSNGDTILTLNLKNRKSHYFKLANIIASKYFKDYGKCSPRSKTKHIDIEGMIKGKVGMRNEYPKEYIKYIIEYENLIPLDTWEDLPQYIERFEDTFRCTCCDSKMIYSSINKHILSKKHRKNI